jgi:L-lactate dehydrogenase
MVLGGDLLKIAIIGAGGRVGSCAAYALQWSGIASEIILVDVVEALVQGEALDLLHGSALIADQRICAGTAEDAAKADLIVITAGLRRKPDESRLALINRNVSLFLSIIEGLKDARIQEKAILLIVSNPVDILTYLAAERSGLPQNQVIGLGTLLDTCRFCSLIAKQIEAAPTQVKALILGEHGNSMVPIWSSAQWNGVPLEKHASLSPAQKIEIFERTRDSGAEIIRLKGGAGWAVATCIESLARAILLDQRKLLPVSTLQTGAYGMKGICMSVPTIVGRNGVLKHVEVDLWPREIQGLRKCENTLKETLSTVKQQTA